MVAAVIDFPVATIAVIFLIIVRIGTTGLLVVVPVLSGKVVEMEPWSRGDSDFRFAW